MPTGPKGEKRLALAEESGARRQTPGLSLSGEHIAFYFQ